MFSRALDLEAALLLSAAQASRELLPQQMHAGAREAMLVPPCMISGTEQLAHFLFGVCN